MAKSKNRGNGEGSIYQLNDGRWRCALTVGRYPGGTVRRITRTRLKRVDASAALDELRQRYQGQQNAWAVRRTLAAWLEGWLESIKPDVTLNTYLSYKNAVVNHISPHVGAVAISGVSKADVRRWLGDLATNGVGGRSRQLAFIVLKSALQIAVAEGVLPENPCIGVRRPKHTAKSVQPFTRAEVQKILKAVRGDHYHEVYLLAFLLGLRQGEIFGLHWESVDFSTNRLTIKVQALDIDGRVELSDVKTTSSNRTLDMPKSVVKALAKLKRTSTSATVIAGPNGGIVRRTNFRRRQWQPLLKRLGLEYRGFHHSRHTYATLLLGSGTPVTAVSKILGHANPSVTLSVYSHFLPEHSQAATDAIQRLLG